MIIIVVIILNPDAVLLYSLQYCENILN